LPQEADPTEFLDIAFRDAAMVWRRPSLGHKVIAWCGEGKQARPPTTSRRELAIAFQPGFCRVPFDQDQ